MANTTPPTLTKKPHPIPWSHQETVNLITTYQQKWYSLKRGPLRGTQWEEVAAIVAARCGYDYNHPSKSAIQCRHKMEKLRQRHRSEKHRLSTTSSAASSRSWQYFRLMDDLERGPLPISVRPFPHNQEPTVTRQRDEIVVDDDDDEEEGVMAKSLTAELRGFAERIVGMENRKMEMMRETERFRLEMENKRLRLILESQWKIVDSIGRAFRSS